MDVTVVIATYGQISWLRAGNEAAEHADNAPVIRIHGQRDLATARNDGLAQVTTEFVCFLDADDSLQDGYFQAMRSGTADIRQPTVSGWGETPTVPHCTAPHRTTGHTLEADCLRYGNPLCIGAVARTDILKQVGGFDPRWPVIEDYALWRAAAINGATIEPIPEAVYLARTRRNRNPRNRTGGRKLRQATHEQIDAAHPW